MSIDDHTVLRTTPRSVCCLVLLFVIVTLNTACRMRDIAMSNVKHEARRRVVRPSRSWRGRAMGRAGAAELGRARGRRGRGAIRAIRAFGTF